MSNEIEDYKKQDPPTKAATAAALWIRGASMVEIKDMLGYATERQAQEAAEWSIAQSVSVPEREAARSIIWQRYERLFKSVLGRATNVKDPQQIAFNGRANAILNDQVKLLGVAAPTRVEYTPDQEYLDDFISKVQKAAGLNPEIIEEADIFDAEIVEGTDGET